MPFSALTLAPPRLRQSRLHHHQQLKSAIPPFPTPTDFSLITRCKTRDDHLDYVWLTLCKGWRICQAFGASWPSPSLAARLRCQPTCQGTHWHTDYRRCLVFPKLESLRAAELLMLPGPVGPKDCRSEYTSFVSRLSLTADLFWMFKIRLYTSLPQPAPLAKL